FFQLIDRRYEQKSTIITSNISIEKWHTIFDDVVLAQAIVDRLVHHSHIFNINGKSYRLRDLTKEPKGGQF
ncbi:MAG: ATP-binding protein, partial [Culicoidibacterales bacterium]